MNNLITYLLELNISFLVLFVAYKILFEKDKNFVIRRIYLMGVILLPFLLPLLPESAKKSLNGIAPFSIDLEGVTVYGSGVGSEVTGTVTFGTVLIMIYLLILTAGLINLLIQLAGITRAIFLSERMDTSGTSYLSNSKFHASSFFGFIFIDLPSVKEDTFHHILEHENIHKREWHSIDRLLVELFVLVNWFNPLVWMFRKSVIENLEYLADSAVVRKGTDPMKYQWSILNQYIGSASISNQFSSQIKNRIVMLNKDYKLGSKWKLLLLIPLLFIAFIAVSCTEKETSILSQEANLEITQEMEMIQEEPTDYVPSSEIEDDIFFIVEEMPTFQGEKAATGFRKYIARNLRYPQEAHEIGATGKVFIRFIVTKTGKVVIPDPETMAKVDQKPLEEVVIVGFRILDQEQKKPDQKYINMLKEEVIRVISESPDWEPGMQSGKAVNVMYTFPVTFAIH